MKPSTHAISSNDCVQPFYFNDIAARGALVKIENSFVEAVNGRPYGDAINSLLGQSLAAVCLMSTHLKFSSRLSIQARSMQSARRSQQSAQDASIDMLLAETKMDKHGDSEFAMPHQSIRGLVRMKQEADVSAHDHATLANLLGPSQLAVTIEPDNGERYQGIINAQCDSLSESLVDYFRQSEQLDTRLLLFASSQCAAGLLLQEMPNHGGKSERCPIGFEDKRQADIWQEISVLAHSITEDELFNLTAEDCLHRLFHQHNVALADPVAVIFDCGCSYERTRNALRTIAYDELLSILKEDGDIVMDCEFCSARYRFDKKAIDILKNQQDGSKVNN